MTMAQSNMGMGASQMCYLVGETVKRAGQSIQAPKKVDGWVGGG